MKSNKQRITSLAENLQKEAHDYANAIMETTPNMDYQSVFNSWVFLKLAELFTIKQNNEIRLK